MSHMDGDVKEVIEVELLEHRNCMPLTIRTYIRTKTCAPEQQDQMVNNHMTFMKFRLKNTLALFLELLLQVPPSKVKQIQNRKHTS